METKMENPLNKQPVLFTCLVCNFETVSPNFDLSNYPKVKVTCPKCSSDKFKMTE